MDEQKRLETLKKYMKTEFEVTPENIDEELAALRKEIHERGGRNARKRSLGTT